MSIIDIVACQMAKGMPELIKYTVKNHKTTVLTKSQKLEDIKLKLRELKKEDAKCNSQIEKNQQSHQTFEHIKYNVKQN